MSTEPGTADEDSYLRHDLKSPVLTGLPLKAFIALTETPLFALVRTKLLRDNGYPQVLEEREFTETPLFYPDTHGWPSKDSEWRGGMQQDGDAVVVAQAAAVALGITDDASSDVIDVQAFGHSKVMDFYTAYIEKKITPSLVAERIIEALEESEKMTPPMRFLIAHDAALLRAQAASSTDRFASSRPLSIFDGVPFAVKDEVDVDGFQTTAGTAFIAKERDAMGTVPGVSALLDAGALLVGKTNMHEIGLGTTGLNTHHGTPRNPHDISRHTGGSSSGSASIVSSGLCAFALGADGGGSIRIPSALCGCVGLKPTQDRICPHPGPQIAYTVGVVGPIAHSVADCALMYALLANRGHAEHGMKVPPPLKLPNLRSENLLMQNALKGVTVGVHWEWFEHCADMNIVAACKNAVKMLETAGVRIVPVQILYLREISIAHAATIAPEMRSAVASYYNRGSLRRQLSAETRISLATAGAFTAPVYMSAQKIRRKADLAMRKVFQSCDIIATPTVPILAPPVLPGSLDGGASDLGTTVALMRFSQVGNMLGLPAISVPVGNARVEDGSPLLPIGLQLMATPWQEASLLHAGAVLEASLGSAARPLPTVHWDLLKSHI